MAEQTGMKPTTRPEQVGLEPVIKAFVKGLQKEKNHRLRRAGGF